MIKDFPSNLLLSLAHTSSVLLDKFAVAQWESKIFVYFWTPQPSTFPFRPLLLPSFSIQNFDFPSIELHSLFIHCDMQFIINFFFFLFLFSCLTVASFCLAVINRMVLSFRPFFFMLLWSFCMIVCACVCVGCGWLWCHGEKERKKKNGKANIECLRGCEMRRANWAGVFLINRSAKIDCGMAGENFRKLFLMVRHDVELLGLERVRTNGWDRKQVALNWIQRLQIHRLSLCSWPNKENNRNYQISAFSLIHMSLASFVLGTKTLQELENRRRRSKIGCEALESATGPNIGYPFHIKMVKIH